MYMDKRGKKEASGAEREARREREQTRESMCGYVISPELAPYAEMRPCSFV